MGEEMDGGLRMAGLNDADIAGLESRLARML